MNKTLLIFLFMFAATSVPATTNLSDAIDENQVPAEQEKRENEMLNFPDDRDRNDTPAVLEERQQKEEWRESYRPENKPSDLYQQVEDI